LRVLLDPKADVESKDNFHFTPAAPLGDMACVEVL